MPLFSGLAARLAAPLTLALLQVGAGGSILALAPQSARAAEPIAFTIPAEDGYGLEDCLQAGSACGQAVANSWCEAHGHLKAVAFGAAGDVTGTIAGQSPARKAAAGSMLIRCGD